MNHQTVLLLMLKAYTSILSISCTGAEARQTATTRIKLGELEFDAAADSQSGTNTIHPRALAKLMQTDLPLPFSRCNVTVECADRSLHKITSQVLLKFSLPDVSNTQYSMPFLVMETPHDFILSMYTMKTTGLGQHIFNQDKPKPAPSAPDRPPSSIHHLIDKLDFNLPDMYTTILSIIASTVPDHEAENFTELDELPECFNATFNDNPEFDPPHIEAPGLLGTNLTSLINNFSDNVFRRSLPPEPARVPPFQIEFAELAPQIMYRHVKESVEGLLKNRIAVVPSPHQWS